jgi:hypothetical protein
MVVCVVLGVWTIAWNIRWHAGQKGLEQYKWIKGENPGFNTKQNPTGGMDVCVLFVVRTVIWNVKWHEGRKDLNSTKMDQRGKPPVGATATLELQNFKRIRMTLDIKITALKNKMSSFFVI